jgi:hypothetical protein
MLLFQAFLVILLFALGACKIWFLNNINNASKGAGKVKGDNVKKTPRLNKQFAVATIFDTIHGLGVSMLASTLP